MSTSGESVASAGADAPGEPPQVEPVQVDTLRVIEAGMALWAVALVILLAVPPLRAGDRGWWVQVPVAALVLGAIGWAYVRRGRGNAQAA